MKANFKDAFKTQISNPQWHPLLLVLLSTLSSVLLYIPLLLKDKDLLFRYWDGPNYLYVAKTLYDIPDLHPFVTYGTTPAYFACHLPLYPLLIRLFSYLLGYPAAMLAVTLTCSSLACYLFYRLLCQLELVRIPFWSAVLFLFLPARWLVYHSLGATEPLFLCLVFGSMLCWLNKRPGWAMFLVGLSSVTRIVGVLVALAYLLLMLREKRWRQLPLLLITPLPLLATFSFYAWRFGDFWAYFSWNAKLLDAIPMRIIYIYAANNQAAYAEFYLALYLLYGVGVLLLWRQPLLFFYGLVFWTFNLFIYHEDLSRYYIPIAPFALIVAYDRYLSRRAFQLMFPVLVFGVYLMTWPLIYPNSMDPRLWPMLIQALNR